MQQGMQELVLDIVEARFPLLLEAAKQQIALLSDKSKLSQLGKQITLASDEIAAQRILSTIAA